MKLIKNNILDSLSILFTNRIWSFSPEGYSKPFVRLVRFVKLLRVTLDSFFEYKMGFQCVALSYFVALAIIPLATTILAISGGIGLSDKIRQILINFIPNHPEITGALVGKANDILAQVSSGGIGVVSALFFLWTIFWMMFQVERVFNNVWGIRKIPRKFYTRIGYYILLTLLIPFIVLLFGTGLVFYTNITNLIGIDMSGIRGFSKFMGYSGFYILAVGLMSVMYKCIPATFVRYRYAIRASLFSALVFTLFQYLYLETQVFVARLNAVYGVIAAIPLFMMWLNFSWQIIIFGAQLCFGMQNIDTYKTLPESKI